MPTVFTTEDVTFTDTNEEGEEETVTIPAAIWEKIVGALVRITVEQTNEMPTAYPAAAMVEATLLTIRSSVDLLPYGEEVITAPMIFHAHSPLGAMERVHVEPPAFLYLLAEANGMSPADALRKLLHDGAEEVKEYVGPEMAALLTSFKSEADLVEYAQTGKLPGEAEGQPRRLVGPGFEV